MIAFLAHVTSVRAPSAPLYSSAAYRFSDAKLAIFLFRSRKCTGTVSHLTKIAAALINQHSLTTDLPVTL